MVKIIYLSDKVLRVTPALLDLQILHELFDGQLPIINAEFKY